MLYSYAIAGFGQGFLGNFLDRGGHLSDDICPFYGLRPPPRVLHLPLSPLPFLPATHAAFMWPMLVAPSLLFPHLLCPYVFFPAILPLIENVRTLKKPEFFLVECQVHLYA